ncbi:MAG: apolipoprotein N-acyltransferase [Candidatus Nanopelagicales bacterium]|nr:apolipoprotein N-acyltransferase [Candidatus Nanopelagicales bacterium]
MSTGLFGSLIPRHGNQSDTSQTRKRQVNPRLALLLWRPLAALGGGLAMACAFPPLAWWWIAPIAVLLCVLSTRKVRPLWAATYGAIAGVAFFGPLLSWMSVVGIDAWISLTAICSAWWIGLFVAQSFAQRFVWWPVVVPALWVASEAIRGAIPLGGFPWGRLAFSQAGGPLLPLNSIVGPAGLAYALAFVACAVVYLLLDRRSRPPWATTMVVAIGSVSLSTLLAFGYVASNAASTQNQVTIAVVQGGVPGVGLSAMGEKRAVLANHTQLTRTGLRSRPEIDFVVWPENSTDIDPFRDPLARRQIDEAARTVGTPILVGAVVDAPNDPSRVANSGIVWDPATGPGARYVKRHPVPFGEFIPFRSLLGSLLDRFRLVPRDFIAGDAPGVLEIAGTTVGDVICFEVAYDSIVRDVVIAGAQVIVVQTNNATYAGTAQLQQQVAMSQVRAVEHGRSVVVAATSGISAVINPNGSIRTSIAANESGVLVERIALSKQQTLATAWAPRIEWLLVGFAAASLACIGLSRLRRQRSRS